MKKKYTVELTARLPRVQMFKLTEAEKKELAEAEKNIHDAWIDFCEKHEYDFYLEGYYVAWDGDSFMLTITDEDGKVIHEVNNTNTIINQSDEIITKYDEDEDDSVNAVEGWEFKGVEDGCYFVYQSSVKGCAFDGEFELDEEFDPSRLYLTLDTHINDELFYGGDAYVASTLYYRRGDEADIKADAIDMEWMEEGDDSCVDISILEVKNLDLCTKIR